MVKYIYYIVVHNLNNEHFDVNNVTIHKLSLPTMSNIPLCQSCKDVQLRWSSSLPMAVIQRKLQVLQHLCQQRQSSCLGRMSCVEHRQQKINYYVMIWSIFCTRCWKRTKPSHVRVDYRNDNHHLCLKCFDCLYDDD